MRQSSRRIPTLFAVGVIGVAGSILSGCGAGDSAGGAGGPTVVVSSSIWGDVVEQVAGECAEVQVLMRPGVDPHGFEPSARQAVSMRESDLVIINGIGLEEQLESVLDTAERDGVAVFAVGEALDPVPFGEKDGPGPPAGDGDHGDHGDHGDLDPHVWQDPGRVAKATSLIAEQVAAHTDCDADALLERADTYAEELRRTAATIGTELDSVPAEKRKIVTNHDAWGYFADRFGFTVIGSVIPSGTTLAEPSSAELAALARVLVDTGVEVIFTESSGSAKLAESLAQETGEPIEIVELYSDALGEPGSGADSYIGMIETNARRVAAALAS